MLKPTSPVTIPEESPKPFNEACRNFFDRQSERLREMLERSIYTPAFPSRPRPLEIVYQDRGLTIKVGCKVFAFSSFSEAQPYIVRYYSDPEGTERLYNEGKLFDQPKTESSAKKKSPKPANPRKHPN